MTRRFAGLDVMRVYPWRTMVMFAFLGPFWMRIEAEDYPNSPGPRSAGRIDWALWKMRFTWRFYR